MKLNDVIYVGGWVVQISIISQEGIHCSMVGRDMALPMGT